MKPAQRRFMGCFRLFSLLPLLCAVAAVSTADTKPAARTEFASGEMAKRFVATLLEKSAAPIGKPEGCLSKKPRAATVGRELSIIFGNYIDAEWSFSIVATCEKDGGGPTRQFCRLKFNHKDDVNEASVGFNFRGNPANGAVDIRTLECFQTP
jgi:hypothetical protein